MKRALHNLPARCNSSMQLTRAGDYAVRVMVHLAMLPEDHRATLPDLADATDTPESFLSKVLQSLTRSQLIASRRGKAGGFTILPRGRNASMRDVIEAIDGPVRLNVCLNGSRECDRRAQCPAHPVWARAQRSLMEVLMSVSVAEMAGKAAAHPNTHRAVSLDRAAG